MPVYIRFQLSVYFSFYLAVLLDDRHLPTFPYAETEASKKLAGSVLNRLRKTKTSAYIRYWVSAHDLLCLQPSSA
jgi:hypothetical protein